MESGAIPIVFDRALMRARLTRALALGYEPFLLDRAVTEALDRLATVKRRFVHALDLGTPAQALAQALIREKRVERVTRAAPVRDGVAADGIATVVASEDALPFAPAAFDLVLSLLSLQAVNDLPGALAQIRRALKPDGLFLACLPGGATLTELRQSFVRAETDITGGASPRVAPFADVRDMGGLLQRAGFALPVADVDRIVVRYDNVFALMRDLRRMGWTNILRERRRAPLRRDMLMRAAAIYAEDFSDADGRVRATFDLIWLSGWAPHESQQKPLKPGSAKARLAEALGTSERPAGEKAGA